jgi:hypothetical protein
VNGKGHYGENCYNSGLKEMAEGKCYTMNPARANENPVWINEIATQTWWWVETSCGEVVVSSSSVEPESSSSEVVVESSSSEVVVESSSSEVVVESSSSETPVSSSSVEPESSSSEIVVSACIAFKNGKGDYDKNCYNSGLRGMAEGKCYTMNPDRVKEGVPQWINEEASQTWWWVETPCDATVVKKALGRDNGTTRIVAAAEVKANMAVVNNSLNIATTSNGMKSVKVFDVRGNMLLSETFSGASMSMDMSKFAGKGAVIVRLAEGRKVLATKRVAVR